MAYETKVGDPSLSHCSLCRSERVIDPDTFTIWCRRCDGPALRLALTNRGRGDG